MIDKKVKGLWQPFTFYGNRSPGAIHLNYNKPAYSIRKVKGEQFTFLIRM